MARKEAPIRKLIVFLILIKTSTLRRARHQIVHTDQWDTPFPEKRTLPFVWCNGSPLRELQPCSKRKFPWLMRRQRRLQLKRVVSARVHRPLREWFPEWTSPKMQAEHLGKDQNTAIYHNSFWTRSNARNSPMAWTGACTQACLR